jgi:hypothetical protein
MKYTRYFLRCKFEIDGKDHDEYIWTFKSMKSAKSVLDLMKEDGANLGEYLYIEKFTKEEE